MITISIMLGLSGSRLLGYAGTSERLAERFGQSQD